jgi:DNA-binding transcriptional ArsR family regulator
LSSVIPQCTFCKHAWNGSRRGEPSRARCDAFPGGIPDEILWNRVRHDSPYPGDQGIQFEPLENRVASKAPAAHKAKQRLRQAAGATTLLEHVSDPTRLELILILAEGEWHVGALCARLGQKQPAVSHHLALLKQAGIIAPHRRGKNNFYTLTDAGSALVGVVRRMQNPSSVEGPAPVSVRSANHARARGGVTASVKRRLRRATGGDGGVS